MPPTAKQLDELVHETELRSSLPGPLEAGAATIDQLAPFQCSNRPAPTAKQSDTLEHDTSARSPCGGPAGLALGTIDQRGAAPEGDAVSATAPVTSAIAVTIEVITGRRGERVPLTGQC